jgi:hypothetical protein
MNSECVFVKLCVLHAMRMRRIILSSVACPFLQYFATLYHKRHYFRKKRIRRMGADLFNVDRQSDRRTDMMKLTVAFRNFANAANNRSADQGNRAFCNLYSQVAVQYKCNLFL